MLSTCFLSSRKIPHMLSQIHQRHRPRAAAEPGTSLIALDILTSHFDLHQKQSNLMICPAGAEWQVVESQKLERIAQMRAFLRQLSLPVAKQVVNQTVCPSGKLLVASFQRCRVSALECRCHTQLLRWPQLRCRIYRAGCHGLRRRLWLWHQTLPHSSNLQRARPSSRH